MSAASMQQILQQGVFDTQFNAFSNTVLNKLKLCRTAAMGYHQYRCQNTDCQHIHFQYHGCRNRHCPVCNWQKQEQWMEARLNELLPVKYYHVVFTLPHELNSLVMGNRAVFFKQLFESTAHTLLTLSRDPKWLGATPSITAVLHTRPVRNLIAFLTYFSNIFAPFLILNIFLLQWHLLY